MKSTFFAMLVLIVLPVAAPSQTELPRSLKDQAMQQLQAGHRDTAIDLYTRWLVADPRDNSSWYNLACAQSLTGDTAAALTSLENAVETGWKDAALTISDTDLSAIGHTDRFAAAVEKMKAAKQSDGPKNYVRRHVSATTVGTYIVMLPEDYATSGKSYPICVLLHGSGSTELKHGRMADWLGRDDVIYAAPRALNPHEGAIAAFGSMGYTAWPSAEIDSTSPLRHNPALDYANLIHSVTADVKSNYRTTGRVWVLGHSQGAAFAWIAAASNPTAVERIFCYAGYFEEPFNEEHSCKDVGKADVSVTIVHGTADRSVNPDQSKDMHDRLEKYGVKHTYISVDGATHAITKEVSELMKSWISDGLK